MKIRVNFKDTEFTMERDAPNPDSAIHKIMEIMREGIMSISPNGDFSYYPPHTIKRIDYFKE